VRHVRLVGIEVGQLVFVVAVLGIAAAVRRRAWPAWARQVPAYAIGSCAAYWVCERVVAMLV
jgi:hypothetical protein